MASSNADVPTPVPFPKPDDLQTAPQPAQPATTSNATPNSPSSPQKRSRTSTNASIASTAGRVRAASIKMMEAAPPPGMWAATGMSTSKAPTLADIRRGSFGSTGWNEEQQRESRQEKLARRASESEEGGRKGMFRRGSSQNSTAPDSPIRQGMGKARRQSSQGTPGATALEPFAAVTEEPTNERQTEGAWNAPKYDGEKGKVGEPESEPSIETSEKPVESAPKRHGKQERVYSNGYVPPPKVPWTVSTKIGLKAFWKWFLTPSGFLITVYGLNVVAWGGMLFLLLCNASPAMCHPTCNDLQSPRRIWIEIDSQILNALFCVTGFGLFPWRARDLYWWSFWRLGGSKRKETGIRRLAGIHRGWFRLPGSDHLPPTANASNSSPEDPAIPIPLETIPDPPPTGIHAPPTNGWKMDFVVWMNMWNTFFQIVLCFFMWHFNRYQRPSWATGLFVALGCIVAGLGGIMMFHEGKYVKKVEGVPVPKGYEDQLGDVEAQRVEAVPAGQAKS